MVGNFAEVWLAKEGHDGVVGINCLEKIQLATPTALLGAMLGGVDYVLMGAGIPREVPQLLREALLANGVLDEQILVIPSEEAAVDAALREAEPGDLLLIFGDAITRSWKQIIQFHPEAAPPPAEQRRASRPEPARLPSYGGRGPRGWSPRSCRSGRGPSCRAPSWRGGPLPW